MSIPNFKRGISPKSEIAKMKNGSSEYDKAIDDVLNLLNKISKYCQIVHTETGLFFNGYDNSFPKGKNTLSQTHSKRYLSYGKTDEEILEIAFGEHITTKNNERKYVSNKIVYEGSEINKTLSKMYSDIQNIPLKDFSVKHEK